MTDYKYAVSGLAANGQTWSTPGFVRNMNPGEFRLACDLALRESFERLTRGQAVFGQPGLRCDGPYQITAFSIERLEGDR